MELVFGKKREKVDYKLNELIFLLFQRHFEPVSTKEQNRPRSEQLLRACFQAALHPL